MRYFVEFSYNGKAYHGWQKQSNSITIQDELTRCMSLQLHQQVELIGAGRTDAGVHAMQMFAHFNITNEIDSERLITKLNSFLPNDILIHDIFKVKEKIHARFSAVERTYQYFISDRKNVFNNNIYVVHKDIDICKMNESCKVLIGKHDFTSFSKLSTDTVSNICSVTYAAWDKEGDVYTFTISANRFLRNMVRSIVGTLLDIGAGKKDIKEIQEIIDEKDRCKAGFSVPAKGLFLKSIQYPDGIRE